MNTKSYYPQLDSLRTIAAIGVINLHWLNHNYLMAFGIDKSFNWGFGKYGVQLFFVLSGFLITEILIRNKDSNNKGKVILNFFIRRALRLFPIYYLLVLYLILIKDQFVIDNVGWFLTYTVNIKFFLLDGLIDVWSNHLWTLSIEEQFYLLFPVIFLFTPKIKEYLLPLAFIFIAVVTKQIGHGTEKSIFLLTIAQTDMLGIGILIALIKHKHESVYLKLSSNKMATPIIILLIANVIAYYFFLDNVYISTFFPYSLMISFGLLVLKATYGFTGCIGRILEFKFLKHLGKISYGLYLYHKVIPLSLLIIFNKFGVSIENVVLYYLINFILLVAISHLSWIILESPILRLKSRYMYK